MITNNSNLPDAVLSLENWMNSHSQSALSPLFRNYKDIQNELLSGNSPRWIKAFAELPDIPDCELKSTNGKVCIQPKSDISPKTIDSLHSALMNLRPWRKGPFQFADVFVDTEWRSDMKWQRLLDAGVKLTDRKVLDIGCGNGYYMWRMLEQNPASVLGVDPSTLFFYQFHAVQKYIQAQRIALYPAGIDELDGVISYFDTVFAMGILYHRPSPVESLKQIAAVMQPGADLWLETLTIEGSGQYCLSPLPRYAKMRNVYFLPTDDCLENWLETSGFENNELISVDITQNTEQRKTEWILSQSLEDFLDPANSKQTVEGYPAPRRSLWKAKRKAFHKG